jgi:magnesium-transporting ATPase (P-type)
MFEATHWVSSKSLRSNYSTFSKYFKTIYEPDNRVVVRSGLGQEIQIVRSFEFSSLLQRMSVIVKINEEFYLFAKGSPEMMKTLSIKQTRTFRDSNFFLVVTNSLRQFLATLMKFWLVTLIKASVF